MKRPICAVFVDDEGLLECMCSQHPDAASAAFTAVAAHCEKLGVDVHELLANLRTLDVRDLGSIERCPIVYGGLG